MFSRRHPFLFFFLVLFSITAVFFAGMTALIFGGSVFIRSSVSSVVSPSSDGNVGVVELTGVITSSKKIIEQIKTFKENSSIKAIVLRVNSPGGGVGPSQEIYREILKTKKTKKVIASFGSVAASGGYYAACASDGIMADPGTITGSIGVIMEYANFQEIMKKIGLAPVVIKSGKFKDMGSPVRPIKDEEKKILQGVADEIHLQFIKDVAKGRGIQQDKIAKIADGRIYTGEKAMKIGLVDKLGNLDDAIDWAGKLGGVKGKIKAVYPEKDRIYSLKKIFESLFKNSYITGAMPNYFRYIIN